MTNPKPAEVAQEKPYKHLLQNAQVYIPTSKYYPANMTTVVLPKFWSKWNPPTMREAKRATKHLELLVREGNMDLSWAEGYWNRSVDVGVLIRGSSWGRKDEKFIDFVFDVAERMGYDVEYNDSCSTCDQCNLAIDTGSTSPDPYQAINEIMCEKCLNDDPIGNIEYCMNNDPFFGRLNWEPKLPQRFDYEKGFCQVEFENIDKAELFCKLYIKSGRMKTHQRHGYSWDPVTAYFFVDDLSFDVKDKRNDDDQEPANMSHVFDIDTYQAEEVEIEWKHANFPTRLNQKSDQGILWEDIRDCLEAEEEKTPLLVWFCKGWITKGLWFQRDTATFNELIESWRSSGHERLTELIDQNLGLSRTELDELP